MVINTLPTSVVPLGDAVTSITPPCYPGALSVLLGEPGFAVVDAVPDVPAVDGYSFARVHVPGSLWAGSLPVLLTVLDQGDHDHLASVDVGDLVQLIPVGSVDHRGSVLLVHRLVRLANSYSCAGVPSLSFYASMGVDAAGLLSMPSGVPLVDVPGYGADLVSWYRVNPAIFPGSYHDDWYDAAGTLWYDRNGFGTPRCPVGRLPRLALVRDWFAWLCHHLDVDTCMDPGTVLPGAWQYLGCVQLPYGYASAVGALNVSFDCGVLGPRFSLLWSLDHGAVFPVPVDGAPPGIDAGDYVYLVDAGDYYDLVLGHSLQRSYP